MRLLDENEGMRFIQEHLLDRSWWTILAPDLEGCRLATMIEQAHYAGEKNSWFKSIMVPRPFAGCVVMSVFFAKKDYMTFAEYRKLHQEATAQKLVGPDDADILVCITPLGLLSCRWLSENFRSK